MSVLTRDENSILIMTKRLVVKVMDGKIAAATHLENDEILMNAKTFPLADDLLGFSLRELIKLGEDLVRAGHLVENTQETRSP